MRVDAKQLAAEGLRLELDGPDGEPNCLVLGPSTGVTGGYAQGDEALLLDAISAEQLRIAELSWGLSFGRLQSEGQAQLENAKIDATIPRQSAEGEPGFLGTISAARLELPVVHVRLEQLTVRLDSLILEDLQVRLEREGIRISAARLHADKLEVRADAFRAQVEGVELAQGLAVDGDDVRLPDLALSDLSLELPDLTQFGSSGGKTSGDKTSGDKTSGDKTSGDKTSGDKTSGESKKSATASALRFLDALAGRLHVDLTVDATVPLIGRRKATHRFRLPVRSGTIDFHELEHDLSSLEDAVLDFRVRDGKLCLERDLSMLRFWSKVLVYWELTEPDEYKLAKENRVKLRRLAFPKVPEPRKQEEVEKGKQGVVVRQLDFNNLDVALSLDRSQIRLSDGARIRLGAHDRLAIDSLKIEGDVMYEPGRAIDPTELDLSATKIHFGIEQLPAGERKLDIDRVDLDEIRDIAVTLEGVQPMALSAEVYGIRLRDLVLTPGS